MKRLPGKATLRAHRGTLAIIALTFALGTVIQTLGWAQTSNYALVRALSHGTAKIDRYSWESRDASYYSGHYYSVKAPGMAFVALPAYELLKFLGARDLSREIAQDAHRNGAYRWYRAGVPSQGQYANDLALAKRVRADIENYTPFVWMLNLFVGVLPALIMMLLVRACVERVEPGTGTAAAVVLGAGTMVMPFATLFFSHVMAAMLAFACFALLWREREGPPRLVLLAIAGALAGFAITSEYPLGIAAIVCAIYALSRGNVVRRGLAYGIGLFAGVLPLLLYNLLAFGSLTHSSYANAIKEQGQSGHDVLGLNDGGLFGVGWPSLHNAADLLFSSKGLFVISPVLIMGLVGIVLMYRRGRRAEALAITGVVAGYVLYNSGYWLPFGGGAPGPRFLIPMLPFLAVPIGLALKRFPATTVALAIPSILTMVAATITLPMIGNGDTGLWVHIIDIAKFEQTLLAPLGSGNGWLGISPFLIALAAALVLTVLATPRLAFQRDAIQAGLAVLTWGALAALTPRAPQALTGTDHSFMPLILVAVASALAAIAIATTISVRRQPVDDDAITRLARET